jgi:hypothetical protein
VSIGTYLEQRIGRDFRKGKLGYVRVGLEDFKQVGYAHGADAHPAVLCTISQYAIETHQS